MRHRGMEERVPSLWKPLNENKYLATSDERMVSVKPELISER